MCLFHGCFRYKPLQFFTNQQKAQFSVQITWLVGFLPAEPRQGIEFSPGRCEVWVRPEGQWCRLWGGKGSTTRDLFLVPLRCSLKAISENHIFWTWTKNHEWNNVVAFEWSIRWREYTSHESLIDPFRVGIQASAALAGFVCYRFVDPSTWFLRKGSGEVVKQ